MLVAQSALVGVDHPGRAFLAVCVYHRYERKLMGELLPKLSELVSRPDRKRALIIGQSARLAQTLSAGMAGVLPQTTLAYEDGKLVLHLPKSLADLVGEPLRRRMRFVAKELGFAQDVIVSEPPKTGFFRGSCEQCW